MIFYQNTNKLNWFTAKVENLEINKEEIGKWIGIYCQRISKTGEFTAELLLNESKHVMCLQLLKYSVMPSVVIFKHITPVLFKLFQALGKGIKVFNLL